MLLLFFLAVASAAAAARLAAVIERRQRRGQIIVALLAVRGEPAAPAALELREDDLRGDEGKERAEGVAGDPLRGAAAEAVFEFSRCFFVSFLLFVSACLCA